MCKGTKFDLAPQRCAAPRRAPGHRYDTWAAEPVEGGLEIELLEPDGREGPRFTLDRTAAEGLKETIEEWLQETE
jgi:hypothetical protein